MSTYRPPAIRSAPIICKTFMVGTPRYVCLSRTLNSRIPRLYTLLFSRGWEVGAPPAPSTLRHRMRLPRASRSFRKPFLKPMMRVELIVERAHLPITAATIEGLRFLESAVRIESHHRQTERARL